MSLKKQLLNFKVKFIEKFQELLKLFHTEKSVFETKEFVGLLNECIKLSKNYFEGFYHMKISEVGGGDIESIKKLLNEDFNNIEDWRGKNQKYIRNPRVQNYFVKTIMKLYHLYVQLCLMCGEKGVVLKDNEEDNESFEKGKNKAKLGLLAVQPKIV